MSTPGHPTRDFARTVSYSPDLDGDADPGEVVWTWVPFEEDPTQGKDRPVLVVGRDDSRFVLGLMLSSQDYHRGDDDWYPIGAGAWDGEHRDSYVRLDRVLRIDDDSIRREGAVVERARFDAVADVLRDRFGWQ
ncbi:type II toxin-antitoxin system PemK/MazF family toxin [Gordonia phthalatica]|uniref:Growth inhibitor PemK n=1 Tax=Gordonia phthalatica TaxID=1136941 RepID=A0A0N9MR29_9ACTN|nr:type II toxin-antitoxin system PemK/MazF family toxin [Gordonia phthalatica]ALG85363.1 growth inhibitor PemK [Gordonia phthalatica]